MIKCCISFTRKGSVVEIELANTLTANDPSRALGNNNPITGIVQVNNMEKLRIRKLTPKECFRLMGFDDPDFEKAEAVNSNTQLYKQAGNSICVPVVEYIINELFDANIL